jgi:uncharacterized protein YjeT (DUF2065 family)
MTLPSKRWKQFAAMLLMGDGLIAFLYPSRAAAAWKVGPKSWKDLMQQLHDRPTLTRALGAAEMAAGIWWALGQQKHD